MAEVRFSRDGRQAKVAVKRTKPSREFSKRGRVKDGADPPIVTLLAPEQHHREPRQLPAAKRESLAEVAQRLGIPRRTAQAWVDGERRYVAAWIGREVQEWADRRSN